MSNQVNWILNQKYEWTWIKNNLHILRRNLIKNGVYDRHVKPDGKVDVQLGVRVLDMDLCPKKHVSSYK